MGARYYGRRSDADRLVAVEVAPDGGGVRPPVRRPIRC